MDKENGWCCQMYVSVKGAMWLRICRWRDCKWPEAAAEVRQVSEKME